MRIEPDTYHLLVHCNYIELSEDFVSIKNTRKETLSEAETIDVLLRTENELVVNELNRLWTIFKDALSTYKVKCLNGLKMIIGK